MTTFTMTDLNECDGEFSKFIGTKSFEDDNGWSREVWTEAWRIQQEKIQNLESRIKLLESEVAWAENGYNKPAPPQFFNPNGE